ncbi:agmatine deiminase family protein [Dokdonella koreensis]|uniref:agmatine deiminase family protein n=1 Tax=Dokdonella koreensis TaxID=323415 RepID=UPI00082952E0|nr:agmatine deiminase family protein [Dokdonella koreensis]
MIVRSLCLLLACVALAVDAAPARRADPGYLATIPDEDTDPLPRGLAPRERATWQLPQWPLAPLAPPPGRVRAQAEYEPSHGLMIRWGAYNALHTSMVVPITTASPPSDVWIVVSGASQEQSARGVLAGGGADMDHVHFITTPSDSVWIRDYGPRFIDDDGRRAISDHTYNRPRPNDDVVPAAVATQWNEAIYALPLRHGGGNFHLFRNREAFMTRLIANENPAVSEQQIIDYYRDYQGLTLTLTDPFPQSYDTTQHIDMWLLPLADGKVLIGQYAAGEGGGVPKTVTDATAALMQERGYTVYRTPGWQSGSTHYTYANSVILNRVVLVCQFNGYPTQNAQAVATYTAALPDHEIVPVDCSSIIGLSGAIHCIVMHVPDLLFRSDYD